MFVALLGARLLMTNLATVAYGPSAEAVALQAEVDKSIAEGRAEVAIAPGDYFFGNTSLAIHQATDFTLRARAGPGTVQHYSEPEQQCSAGRAVR